MITTLDYLRSHKPELLRLAEKYGVRNIEVFGSVARGEDRPESDVDFLIEMEPGRDGFDAGGFQYHSSALLGRHVDIVFRNGIYWMMRDEVLREATPL